MNRPLLSSPRLLGFHWVARLVQSRLDTCPISSGGNPPHKGRPCPWPAIWDLWAGPRQSRVLVTKTITYGRHQALHVEFSCLIKNIALSLSHTLKIPQHYNDHTDYRN